MTNAERKVEFETEQAHLMSMLDTLLNIHPTHEDRPESVQQAIINIGDRLNMVDNMLDSYKHHGSFEDRNISGSGMSKYDTLQR